MVQVANLQDSADKFQRRASAAGQDFEAGVSATSDGEWSSATLNATSTWESGIQDAIADNAFERGVENTTKSWQDRTLSVGSGRFTQGAGQAGPEWQASFAPFADTLEGLSLQPRGPRGSSANFERSRAVGEALHNARTQG